MKKVFVSGSFDMLHSGHVTFLQEAAKYGNLYVGIGNDESILKFKGRKPVCSEAERLFMVKALKCVENAHINGGEGQTDWKDFVLGLRPDIMIVNEDQDTPEKRAFCKWLKIKYKVLKRFTLFGMAARSTTELRKIL
jgi:cytidyltransferase-like protein